MLLRVVHRRWYEFHSHHFSHAVRPCKPPVLLHGKATDRHRKTPYRAAQRFSVWVHASEKNPEVYIFRAASLGRCTESGSGQKNRVRNFVPTLCEGVAFRYSLLHHLVSGCPPELRPCRWGLGDKLTGCSFVSLRNLWSGHNSVPISRKKAFLLRLHGRLFCPPSQAPQSRLAFPLVPFRKSRQNGSKMSKTPFAGFHHAQSKLLKNERVRLCGICSRAPPIRSRTL